MNIGISFMWKLMAIGAFAFGVIITSGVRAGDLEKRKRKAHDTSSSEETDAKRQKTSQNDPGSTFADFMDGALGCFDEVCLEKEKLKRRCEMLERENKKLRKESDVAEANSEDSSNDSSEDSHDPVIATVTQAEINLADRNDPRGILDAELRQAKAKGQEALKIQNSGKEVDLYQLPEDFDWKAFSDISFVGKFKNLRQVLDQARHLTKLRIPGAHAKQCLIVNGENRPWANLQELAIENFTIRNETELNTLFTGLASKKFQAPKLQRLSLRFDETLAGGFDVAKVLTHHKGNYVNASAHLLGAIQKRLKLSSFIINGIDITKEAEEAAQSLTRNNSVKKSPHDNEQ